MKSPIEKLFGRCGECAWGVCQLTDDIILKNVRSARKIPINAKTVICFLFPYYVGDYPQRNLSLYAMLTDYHKVAGEFLNEAVENFRKELPFNSFVGFVDSSPIKEVEAAIRAGLGKRGKNGLLINEKYGSYCFIGEIVTDLYLPFSCCNEVCLNCGLCQKACPANAIGDSCVDVEKCLSALTQKKGGLTSMEEEKIKNNGFIWGCDVCQSVCPLCKKVSFTPFEEFKNRVVPIVTEENLDDVFPESSFAWRKKETILRNIRIVNENNQYN